MAKVNFICSAVMAAFQTVGALQVANAADVAENRLFPFSPSFGGETNVTDFSSLVEAPAGARGFVRTDGERFVTEDGREIRFNGVNFTAEACFPETDESADRVAARLARFGVNCVRLHYFDAPVRQRWTGGTTESVFGKGPALRTDPRRLARLDRLFFALKRKGIYVNLNLHVGRTLDPSVGVPLTHTMQDKGCTVFDPRLIAAQKEYAKELLWHVNPLTGLRYADDPAVALVELNNEDGALAMNMFTEFDRLGAEYRQTLKGLYNAWLEKTYGRAFAREVPLRVGARPPTPADELRDWQRFLYDVEARFFREMYAYLKDELGVKAPVGGTQVRFSPALIQSELDFTDNHDYWCHPKDFTRDAFGTYENTSSLIGLSVFRKMLGARIAGKPHTFSEYNQPFPNEYGTEGQLLLHAYGAFQGWAGVWGYTYSRYADYEMDWTADWFNLASRADVIAHYPACAAMFLRGDVAPAASRVDFEMTEEDSRKLLDVYDYRLYQTIADAGGSYDEGLTNAVALGFVKANAVIRRSCKRSSRSDAALSWTPGKDAYWTCRTKGVKLFQGFVRGRTFDLGDGVRVTPGKTLNDWCTISFTTNKGERVLLAATGVSRNTGMSWREGTPARGRAGNESRPDFVIEAGAYFDRNLQPNDRRLTNWGRGPTINEPVLARIVFPLATRVWMLDEHGERRAELAVRTDGSFEIGREKTLWYEIEAKGRK